jgi:hypothetical protein
VDARRDGIVINRISRPERNFCIIIKYPSTEGVFKDVCNIGTILFNSIIFNNLHSTLHLMHKKLTILTGSKSKADEIILLLADLKPVVRHALYPHEIAGMTQFLSKHNLFLTTSRFKVVFAEERGKFSNLGYRYPLTDPRDGQLHIYISKDEAKAHLAHYFELVENHEGFGNLLGYPICCIEYFQQNFSKGNPNPEHKESHPFINLTKRGKDAVLISHFPCSKECSKSIDIAKRNLSYLHRYYPARAYELRSELGCSLN